LSARSSGAAKAKAQPLRCAAARTTPALYVTGAQDKKDSTLTENPDKTFK